MMPLDPSSNTAAILHIARRNAQNLKNDVTNHCQPEAAGVFYTPTQIMYMCLIISQLCVHPWRPCIWSYRQLWASWHRCREPTLSPLEEQRVLLTADLSLQAPEVGILKHILSWKFKCFIATVMERSVVENQTSWCCSGSGVISIIFESCSTFPSLDFLIYKIETTDPIPKGCWRMAENDLYTQTAGI